MSAPQITRPERLLVVDDDEGVRNLLVTYLTRQGWNVDHAGTSGAARALIAQTHYDLLLLDQQLPDGQGLEIAREVIARDADCGVVLMTAYASVKSAVEALHQGLADYLIKPFASIELVHTSLHRAAENLALRRHNRELVDGLRRQTAQLEALVVRDPLTNLYNHAFFQEALGRELSRATRHQLQVSLVALNIDRFGDLNERLGHATGDRLLQRLAQILLGQARTAEIPFMLRQSDVVARYGGDQLALILPHTDKRGAAAKAESLRSLVARTSFADIGADHVTVSVGVAAYPDDATTRAELVRAAWSAMAAARQSGRNRVCAYLPNMDAADPHGGRDGRLVELLTALDQSISGRQFDFDFQPIHHARGGGIYGYEALLRPTHPIFKGPVELFEIAENSGRVAELGRAVRHGALANVVALPYPTSLFVNLHPFELNDPRLLDVAPDVDEQRARVIFEITESCAIQDFDRISERLCSLRQRGYRIAVDDLGSGYAGLLALSRLTPDFVKLERDLVHRVNEDPRTRRLVRHLVDFANGEGIVVVAEGIETEAERIALEQLGCGLLQGFLLGRPAPSFGACGRPPR